MSNKSKNELTKDLLLEYIDSEEFDRLEFKHYKDKLDPDIFETVCSFSNTYGGFIVIGVTNKDHNIVGVQEKDIKPFKDNFSSCCANTEQFSIKMIYQLTELVIDKNTVLLYTYIEPSDSVCKYKSRIYIRANDGDFDITDSDDLVKQLYTRKNSINNEDEIYRFVTLDDLDQDSIRKAKAAIAVHENRNIDEFLKMDNDAFLKSLSLYKQDFKTGECGYTLACIMLFGKPQTIISCSPQIKTDCSKEVRPETQRWDDRDLIEENFINSYDRIMAFIRKHLDSGSALDENGIEYSPRDALFREAVANILVHRDLFSKEVARIRIFRNSVVFTNGCIPYRWGLLTESNNTPHSKNPNIARVFRRMGYCEEAGSGVRNMTLYNKIYCNNVPIFEEKDIFTATIYTKSPAEITEDILKLENNVKDIITEKGAVDRNTISVLLKLTKNETIELINDMIDKGIVIRNSNHGITLYELNGSSADTDFKKLPKEKQMNLILDYCKDPKTLVEIMNHFGYTDRYYFRKQFINALIESCKLIDSDPENPTDPGKRYYSK